MHVFITSRCDIIKAHKVCILDKSVTTVHFIFMIVLLISRPSQCIKQEFELILGQLHTKFQNILKFCYNSVKEKLEWGLKVQ